MGMPKTAKANRNETIVELDANDLEGRSYAGAAIAKAIVHDSKGRKATVWFDVHIGHKGQLIGRVTTNPVVAAALCGPSPLVGGKNMHVSSYDTNTGIWKHEHFASEPVGPLSAFEWLCADNTRIKEKASALPCGPLSYFMRDADTFVLIAAWSGGRQWFEVVNIFSPDRLPDEKLAEIVDDLDFGDDDVL